MARAPIRRVQLARDVADWLDDQGEHYRANVVRAVCHSNSAYRETLSRLHADMRILRSGP